MYKKYVKQIEKVNVITVCSQFYGGILWDFDRF